MDSAPLNAKRASDPQIQGTVETAEPPHAADFPAGATKTDSGFEAQVERRFGVLPSFFRSTPDAPEVIQQLWLFAQAGYLDNPLPSLFKERLFVYLSRFCEIRYCVARHLGFLLGRGRPAGDPDSKVLTVEEAVALLKRASPSNEQLDASIALLQRSGSSIADWPMADSDLDRAIFDCATTVFLEPVRSERSRRALRLALGGRRFEQLMAYLAFVRTAHFWTLLHPDIEIEPDMAALLRDHEELARLIFEDPEAGRCEMGERLWQELQTLRGEQKVRAIIDALPAAVYTTDDLGRITYYNQAAAELAGREPALGSDEWCVTWKLYWPDGTPLSHDQCPMALALKERRPNRGLEAIAERPDGTRVPFIPYPTPLFDASGTLIGAVNMLVDISARKKAEEAQREGEDRFRKVFDRSNDAIFVLDPERNAVLEVNPAGVAMFGYDSREELLASPLSEFHPEDLPSFLQFVQDVHNEGVGWTDEFACRAKSGRRIPSEISASTFTVNGRRCLLALVRDVTERKRAEESLRMSEANLRLRNEELGRFNQAAVDREMRMIELKKEINDLYRRLGEPARYPLAFEPEAGEPHG